MREKMVLKPAGSESADLIVNIHFDAVQKGNATDFYPREILDLWSPPVSNTRIMEFQTRMAETRPDALLAYADITPVGFGILDPDQGRIGAIYVRAAFTGRHVGAALLDELEAIASRKGCTTLDLDASLNARPFYERYGYTAISEGFFTLPAGKQMASVSMSKQLKP